MEETGEKVTQLLSNSTEIILIRNAMSKVSKSLLRSTYQNVVGWATIDRPIRARAKIKLARQDTFSPGRYIIIYPYCTISVSALRTRMYMCT